MNYTRLTEAQSAAIEASNRAMLALSRERHAAALRARVAVAEAWPYLSAAKNLLARRYAAQLDRRFTGESITQL